MKTDEDTGGKVMRCKIIEIGPESAHFGDNQHLRRPGNFVRLLDASPERWLSGWFYFDEPYPPDDIFIHQMKVCPLEPWGV